MSSDETMNVVQEENKGDQASRTSIVKEEMILALKQT